MDTYDSNSKDLFILVLLKLKFVFCNIGFSNFKVKDHFDKKCVKSLRILSQNENLIILKHMSLFSYNNKYAVAF